MTTTPNPRAAEQQRLAQLAHLDYVRRAATARGSRVGLDMVKHARSV